MTGSRPILTFVGDKINVLVKANGVNGKKVEKKLSGRDFISWQSPVGLNRLQVTALEKGISGGVILLPLEANIGISSLPTALFASLMKFTFKAVRQFPNLIQVRILAYSIKLHLMPHLIPLLLHSS